MRALLREHGEGRGWNHRVCRVGALLGAGCKQRMEDHSTLCVGVLLESRVRAEDGGTQHPLGGSTTGEQDEGRDSI